MSCFLIYKLLNLREALIYIDANHKTTPDVIVNDLRQRGQSFSDFVSLLSYLSFSAVNYTDFTVRY